MSKSKVLTSASKRCKALQSSLEATYYQSLNRLGAEPTLQRASAALQNRRSASTNTPLPRAPIPRSTIQRVTLAAAACTPVYHMQCNSQGVRARAPRTPQVNGQSARLQDSRRGRRRMLAPSFRDLLNGCPYTHRPARRSPGRKRGLHGAGDGHRGWEPDANRP